MRKLRYVVGNKFLLRGNNINIERELDEWGPEVITKITDIVEDDDNEPTVVEMNVPMYEIRWKGLWDKNSDKLYALNQLLPYDDKYKKDEEKFEAKMTKYMKLLNGARLATNMK